MTVSTAFLITKGMFYEAPEEEFICLDKALAIQFAKCLVPLWKAKEWIPTDFFAGWHWTEIQSDGEEEWEQKWYCYVEPIKLVRSNKR